MEQAFIRVLPFYPQPLGDDPEREIPMPVALWRSAKNICEGSGSRCDDSEGLSYSRAGDAVTWWCPRHWYEGCLGPAAPYRLRDLTDGEFAKERAEQQQRFLQDWATVSQRLEAAADLLSSSGLQEQAGRIWQLQGFLRSRMEHR